MTLKNDDFYDNFVYHKLYIENINFKQYKFPPLTSLVSEIKLPNSINIHNNNNYIYF